jgi:poly(A) polymerase
VQELAYRQGAQVALDAALLRAALLEQPLSPVFESDIASGAEAVFPIKARDLLPDFKGPALGNMLKKLEAEWIASGFSLSRETLLGSIR